MFNCSRFYSLEFSNLSTHVTSLGKWRADGKPVRGLRNSFLSNNSNWWETFESTETTNDFMCSVVATVPVWKKPNLWKAIVFYACFSHAFSRFKRGQFMSKCAHWVNILIMILLAFSLLFSKKSCNVKDFTELVEITKSDSGNFFSHRYSQTAFSGCLDGIMSNKNQEPTFI